MRHTQLKFTPPQARLLILALTSLFTPLSQSAEKNNLGNVTITSTTPLPGTNSFAQEIAAPVETYTAQDISESQALDLSDFLNRTVGGVYVNELQGNPLQADINYRGFTASPLLGTPQGISVYLDGVRLNQPFGDVVSWDLIPKSALAAATLIPGSNPLFGLNTLGGALSLTTKDGKNFPGTVVRGSIGSHARRITEIEHGGFNDQGWDWYLLGNQFREDGWRDDSPSRQNQLFGKLGYAFNGSELKLSLSAADNKLTGNGLQENSLLAQRYDSVYTKPDITENDSLMLNLQGKHRINDNTVATGNIYYRKLKTRTLNGDISDDALQSTAVYATGQNRNNTPFPSANCLEAVSDQDGEEAEESCTGVTGRTQTRQRNMGVSGQITKIREYGANSNQFTLGAAYDQSRTSFRQSAEFGYLLPDRSVMGTGFFNQDEGPVNLDGKSRTHSLYATNTYSVGTRWHLTTSGRFNSTRIENFDRINPPGGAVPLDETLNGDHRYNKLNPAVGLTYVPSQRINWYAGLNQGSRTPTSIELGCANPNAPCRLPNSLAGDPFLEQVVTRTIELGMRSKPTPASEFNVEIFRADNRNDILFVAAPLNPNFGYFRNFGETRRQGSEIELAQRWNTVRLSLSYNYLEATFQSDDTFAAASNSSARDVNFTDADGNAQTGRVVDVKKGMRIPLIPRHIVKIGADWNVTPAWRLAANTVAIGNSVARGNENNNHQADGEDFLAGGKNPGYLFVNLTSRYQINPQLSVYGGITNLFDRRYTTAAQLGPQGFANGVFAGNDDGSRELRHSTFFAPGAPRLFSIGLQYQFDRPKRTQ